jgi:hypothetical protein
MAVREQFRGVASASVYFFLDIEFPRMVKRQQNKELLSEPRAECIERSASFEEL